MEGAIISSPVYAGRLSFPSCSAVRFALDGSACCGEDEWPRLLTPQEVEQIHAVPGNRQCADCLRSALGPDGEEARPSWASTNLLVTLSPQAAGVHRSMGAHVSKVLSLTLDEWTHEDFKLMLQGGNDEANKRLESHSAALSFKPDLRSGPADGVDTGKRVR